MAKDESPEAVDKSAPADRLGIMLGWTADELNGRLLLRIQSAQSRPRSQDDVETSRYFLDKRQAALLGNFLLRMSGETAPVRPTKGWQRWLGRPSP